MSSTELNDFFNTYGIGNALRRNLFLAIIGFLLIAIVYEDNKNEKLNDRFIELQKDLYEKMLDRVDKKLDEPVKKINSAVSRVNTTVDHVNTVADRADSTTSAIIKMKNHR